MSIPFFLCCIDAELNGDHRVKFLAKSIARKKISLERCVMFTTQRLHLLTKTGCRLSLRRQLVQQVQAYAYSYRKNFQKGISIQLQKKIFFSTYPDSNPRCFYMLLR